MLQTGLWMHCLWTGLSVGSKAIGSDTIRAWVSQLGLSAHLPEVYVEAHKPSLASHCLKLIIGGSCHKYHFCHDNSFVKTDLCFVMTSILLSWQNIFCRDKHVFVVTRACCNTGFVTTKYHEQNCCDKHTVVTSWMSSSTVGQVPWKLITDFHNKKIFTVCHQTNKKQENYLLSVIRQTRNKRMWYLNCTLDTLILLTPFYWRERSHQFVSHVIND